MQKTANSIAEGVKTALKQRRHKRAPVDLELLKEEFKDELGDQLESKKKLKEDPAAVPADSAAPVPEGNKAEVKT